MELWPKPSLPIIVALPTTAVARFCLAVVAEKAIIIKQFITPSQMTVQRSIINKNKNKIIQVLLKKINTELVQNSIIDSSPRKYVASQLTSKP